MSSILHGAASALARAWKDSRGVNRLLVCFWSGSTVVCVYVRGCVDRLKTASISQTLIRTRPDSIAGVGGMRGIIGNGVRTQDD